MNVGGGLVIAPRMRLRRSAAPKQQAASPSGRFASFEPVTGWSGSRSLLTRGEASYRAGSPDVVRSSSAVWFTDETRHQDQPRPVLMHLETMRDALYRESIVFLEGRHSSR